MITVLYVDADPKICPIISHIFEEYSISVFPAGSGEDALTWLSRYSADVIVSEYNLPGITGIELIRSLRSNGISLPFIFFSESAHSYVKNKACREDIFGFIPRKGLEKRSVLNLLRMVYWAAGSLETEYPRIEDLKHGT
jgi:CheY-like chemotaxis protein